MENKKVLIVEDDPILQRTVFDFLALEGFEMVAASNGEEGIEMAKSENPDLILLDIILPKKDGFEVIETLKADEKTKNIPIILLTNLGSLNDVEKALKMGANNYLVKADYKMEEVAKKVKEVLKIE
jgi:DNA-binding response OmpR family regulator